MSVDYSIEVLVNKDGFGVVTLQSQHFGTSVICFSAFADI